MHISRDGRGHLRVVNKPKDKGNHGRSKHTRPTPDHPTWPEVGRVPLPPRRESQGHHHHSPHHLPNHPPLHPPLHPPHHPPPQDPHHNARPPARPPGPAHPAHRDRPRHFDEKRGIRRHSRELYDEASRNVALDTGTAYPCTQSDLDASGGIYRLTDRHRSSAELRAMWFSERNTGPKVSIRQAALDIFRHNAPGRTPSAKETDAIRRLCIMLDNACQGHWGPDVAIKCFCDLDTVFFRGKLRGHVCVAWAPERDFQPFTWGHSWSLGHGKAQIQLNAAYMFHGHGAWTKRPLQQTLATLVHEMCHAYQMVKCVEHGRDGFAPQPKSPSRGHGKCFGTMMRAVNARMLDVMGLKGDSNPYPFHDYSRGEGYP